jgi:Subtilase family
MPHPPEDGRYPHLELAREQPNPARRKRPYGGKHPNQGGRGLFGPKLRIRVQELESEAQARPRPPAGIQPHLVFRVPLVAGISPSSLIDRLHQVGIIVVGIDPDGAIIAFRDETNLADFRAGVDQYVQGPSTNINPKTEKPYQSTAWDVLEGIDVDHMRLWSRSDRVGRRLAEEVGVEGQTINPLRLYVVDLELWHRGSATLTRDSLDEVRSLLGNMPTLDERIRDEFIGESLCLAKLSVRGTKLSQLLDLDVVAEVELPPVAVFDTTMARQVTARQFPTPPRPPEDGPRVCVLDSGIAPMHPLLANNVGGYEAILTGTSSGVDENGHGTMVAAIAVFGDVRAGYRAGQFESDVTVFSARVLNHENRFDDEFLVITQMDRVLEMFKAAPYRCRVFNISICSQDPWFRDNRRQSLWAESLDHLARKHKVLIVISAGNHILGQPKVDRQPKHSIQSEEVLHEYPNYLLDEHDCGLAEPATAAIVVTVGGVVTDECHSVGNSSEEYLRRPIASLGQPYPGTRVGPPAKIWSAIKPEFVAPAGNGLFTGEANRRTIANDDGGLSVMSFAHDWATGGSLFRFENGTSFAAPRVSRLAARVWHRLRETLEEEVDPNTVRAVMATAASQPQQTVDLIQPLYEVEGVRRVCGYGEIDEDFALNTGDRRVTFVAQGRIPIDTIQIFAIPIPDEFRNAANRKRIIVGLGFDPPVRRRRAEYLGVSMSVHLLRGMTVDEIVESTGTRPAKKGQQNAKASNRPAKRGQNLFLVWHSWHTR